MTHLQCVFWAAKRKPTAHHWCLSSELSFALALALQNAFIVIPLSHIFGHSLGLWEYYKVGTIDF